MNPLVVGFMADLSIVYPGYTGLLDDIRIYDRALSAAEVAELYAYRG